MTPLSWTLVPNRALVAEASALFGLRTKTPVLGFHSWAALEIGVEPGTGCVGPTNFCFARRIAPSRRMLLSLR